MKYYYIFFVTNVKKKKIETKNYKRFIENCTGPLLHFLVKWWKPSVKRVVFRTVPVLNVVVIVSVQMKI